MICWNCGAAPLHRDEPPSSIPPSSHLTHLLSTNNPLSDVEISHIRDSITDALLRMNALNAHIHALSATLARLTAERDGMADRLQKYLAVLSPVRRIPAELICEIFSWTLPHTRNFDDDTADAAPWYLGHICRTWRHIVTGFPPIWRAVSVFHSADYRHQPLAMLQAQLMRSANAPLDINWGWRAGTKTNDAVPLLDVLLPHSNRWKSLRLNCDSSSYASLLPFFRPVKGQLCQLKRLELKVIEYGHSPTAPDFFSIAPHLPEVFLISPDFEQYSPSFPLPWQQITHYRAFLPGEQFFDVLRAASNLVEATVQTDDPVFGGANVTILNLPHLRRLRIEDDGVLTQITAPALEYFSANIISSILPFIHRSSCQLTTLVLSESRVDEYFTLPSEDVISLLRNTPTLRN
ncbi:hypothetical protein DFH06DRAFT_435878 [Mycena polygramma]|nr:hypothetical protein DFH06DRAFT_435878 [Mycena polygramma]